MRRRIAIVDYESGNLCSVANALAKVGADAHIINTPDQLRAADAVVLPGVGAFRDAMAKLTELDLCDALREHIASGKPFLGICVGYQLLFSESEEDGPCAGLGFYAGRVVRFPSNDPSLKVPHIGWNALRKVGDPPALRGIADGAFVYFVHSYYVAPADRSLTATTTSYGVEFASSIARDNVFACQFHPEKSQSIGLRLLENFSRLEA